MIRHFLPNRFLLCFLCAACFFLLTGCTDQEESNIVYQNDIFTPELYQEITEIYLNVSSVDYHITEEAFLHNIYQELAGLALKEESAVPPSAALGFFTFEIRTESAVIPVLLSDNCLHVLNHSFLLEPDTSAKLGALFADWVDSHK